MAPAVPPALAISADTIAAVVILVVYQLVQGALLYFIVRAGVIAGILFASLVVVAVVPLAPLEFRLVALAVAVGQPITEIAAIVPQMFVVDIFWAWVFGATPLRVVVTRVMPLLLLGVLVVLLHLFVDGVERQRSATVTRTVRPTLLQPVSWPGRSRSTGLRYGPVGALDLLLGSFEVFPNGSYAGVVIHLPKLDKGGDNISLRGTIHAAGPPKVSVDVTRLEPRNTILIIAGDVYHALGDAGGRVGEGRRVVSVGPSGSCFFFAPPGTISVGLTVPSAHRIRLSILGSEVLRDKSFMP